MGLDWILEVAGRSRESERQIEIERAAEETAGE